ncbi:MAG: type II CAAX endopeptidase family protein [Candidatus Thermoplasmatota archaeon]|nr:type II CAAX endopeptidase family protein [Candidatus Thermoplasmatota archaeon]
MDVIGSLRLIVIVGGALLRIDALMMLFIKRREVPIAEGITLSLLSPVLALIIFSLSSNPKWRGIVEGPPTYLAISLIGMLLASQLVSVALSGAILLFLPGDSAAMDLPGWGGGRIPSATLSMLLAVYCAVFLSAMSLFLGRDRIRTYMSGRLTASTAFFGALVMLLAQGLVAFVFIVMRIGQERPIPAYPFEMVDILDMALLMVPIALLVPVIEEIAFRGAIQGSVSRVIGPLPSVISVSLLFAVSHLDPVRILPLFLTGLVLGWARHRSGSVLPGIVIHGFNNIAALTVIFLTQ